VGSLVLLVELGEQVQMDHQGLPVAQVVQVLTGRLDYLDRLDLLAPPVLLDRLVILELVGVLESLVLLVQWGHQACWGLQEHLVCQVHRVHKALLVGRELLDRLAYQEHLDQQVCKAREGLWGLLGQVETLVERDQ